MLKNNAVKEYIPHFNNPLFFKVYSFIFDLDEHVFRTSLFPGKTFGIYLVFSPPE